MRKAFTMIEIIFVIVIIGILSAVSIPKLASNRDQAKAGLCAGEIGTIVTEISTNYTKLGYTTFQSLTIEKLTNAKHAALAVSGDTGITEVGTALVKDGISYICEGGATATLGFTAITAGSKDYNLTVTPVSTSSVPAALRASEIIANNFKTTANNTGYVPLVY